MKRYRLLTFVLCAALVGVNVVLVYSGERNKISDEFRERFVKNFQRTSLNTTEGDAMMLRILVESARAKRGIEVGSATGFGAVNMGIAFERTGGHLYTLEVFDKPLAKLIAALVSLTRVNQNHINTNQSNTQNQSQQSIPFHNDLLQTGEKKV